MFQKWFHWVLDLLVALLPLVLASEVSGGTGAEKKASVVAEIKKHIADPSVPVAVPSWVPEALVDWVLNFLVDFIVSQLNKLSFFK